MLRLNPKAGYAIGLKLMENRVVCAVTDFGANIVPSRRRVMRCLPSRALEPTVEPRDLVGAYVRARIVAEVHACKRARHVVRPGTDHDAVLLILLARLMQRRESFQIALHEIVELEL